MRAALTHDMLMWTAAHSRPPERQAAPPAMSAKPKVVPPCPNPMRFMCRFSRGIRSRA